MNLFQSSQFHINGQNDSGRTPARAGKPVSTMADVVEGKPLNKIWLIGGSGDVGTKTARILSSNPALSVVVVARNEKRATAAARDLGTNIRAVALDATAPGAAQTIDAGATVVNFVEETPHSLAETVIAGGGHFIETSASPELVAALEKRLTDPTLPGLAIVNAGLAPGLTNIMADELKSRAPETRSIDLVVELGMGRHHGAAGTFWTLSSIASDYPVRLNGIDRRIQPGALQRRIRFHGDCGDRVAIGFGFSDQIAVARHNDLLTARTFLAFEPAWITRLFSKMFKLKLGSSVARHAGLLTRLLSRGPTFGNAGTRVVAEGYDTQGVCTGRIEIHSGNQAAVTATMVVAAIRASAAASVTGGVQFSQLVSFDEAIKALKSDIPETRDFIQPSVAATPSPGTYR